MKMKYNAELYNSYKQPSSVKMINTATLEMAKKISRICTFQEDTLSQTKGSWKKETKERC